MPSILPMSLLASGAGESARADVAGAVPGESFAAVLGALADDGEALVRAGYGDGADVAEAESAETENSGLPEGPELEADEGDSELRNVTEGAETLIVDRRGAPAARVSDVVAGAPGIVHRGDASSSEIVERPVEIWAPDAEGGRFPDPAGSQLTGTDEVAGAPPRGVLLGASGADLSTDREEVGRPAKAAVRSDFIHSDTPLPVQGAAGIDRGAPKSAEYGTGPRPRPAVERPAQIEVALTPGTDAAAPVGLAASQVVEVGRLPSPEPIAPHSVPIPARAAAVVHPAKPTPIDAVLQRIANSDAGTDRSRPPGAEDSQTENGSAPASPLMKVAAGRAIAAPDPVTVVQQVIRLKGEGPVPGTVWQRRGTENLTAAKRPAFTPPQPRVDGVAEVARAVRVEGAGIALGASVTAPRVIGQDLDVSQARATPAGEGLGRSAPVRPGQTVALPFESKGLEKGCQGAPLVRVESRAEVAEKVAAPLKPQVGGRMEINGAAPQVSVPPASTAVQVSAVSPLARIEPDAKPLEVQKAGGVAPMIFLADSNGKAVAPGVILHGPVMALASTGATWPKDRQRQPVPTAPPAPAASALPQQPRVPVPTQITVAAPQITRNPVSAPDCTPLPGAELLPLADPTPTTTAPAPARLEAMPPPVRQVMEAVQTLPARPVEISLSPEELGRVRLSVATGDSGLVVQVMAERGETLELLRRHIQELAQEVRALGYGSVAFSFSGFGQSADTPPQPQALTGQAAPDHESAAAPAAPAPRRALPSGGLDLRL